MGKIQRSVCCKINVCIAIMAGHYHWTVHEILFDVCVELVLDSFSLCHVNIFFCNMDHTGSELGTIVNYHLSVSLCRSCIFTAARQSSSLLSMFQQQIVLDDPAIFMNHYIETG